MKLITWITARHKFYFIKSLFWLNVVFSQHHGNMIVEPRPPSSSFSFWRFYRAEVKNDRVYNAKEVIKKMRRMVLMVQKYSKELSNEILVQKGANFSKNKRQGNETHSFLSNLILYLDKERKEVRSQAKRNKGGDLLVHLCFHRLLIPRALWVRKKTKKPKDSILYRMKINLNGTSRLSLHLSKTIVWEIHPREKYSRCNL